MSVIHEMQVRISIEKALYDKLIRLIARNKLEIIRLKKEIDVIKTINQPRG